MDKFIPCDRCGGQMFRGKHYVPCESCLSWTCAQCGECVDLVILANRKANPKRDKEGRGPGRWGPRRENKEVYFEDTEEAFQI